METILILNHKEVIDQLPKYENVKFLFAVTGSWDKIIKIWECYSGECLFNLKGHDEWIK